MLWPDGGVNSTSGTDLPIGAGSNTLMWIGSGEFQFRVEPHSVSNNGYVLFGGNRRAPAAWINTTNGTASFGSQAAGGGVTINGNQIYNRAGDLYINADTTGDSTVVIGDNINTTNLLVRQGDLTVQNNITANNSLTLNGTEIESPNLR